MTKRKKKKKKKKKKRKKRRKKKKRKKRTIAILKRRNIAKRIFNFQTHKNNKVERSYSPRANAKARALPF
jgi:hypothetical protein